MKKTNTHLILSRGTHFEGRLCFDGISRLCGFFKGEIISPKGILIIEKEGRAEARIDTQEVIVKGWMKGEIKASHKITLINGAEFYGTLSAPKLQIEEEALFEGQVIKPEGLSKTS